MKSSAIVMVTTGQPDYLEICIPAWRQVAEIWRVELIVRQDVEMVLPDDESYNWRNFHKLAVSSYFDDFDSILRVDADTLPAPTAASPFLLPREFVWAYREDRPGSSREQERRREIALIQEHLGDLNWKTQYFNSGVVLARKAHEKAFSASVPIHNIPGKFKEQNLFNWNLQSLAIPVADFGPRFNYMRIAPSAFPKSEVAIFHFAGPQGSKLKEMKKVHKQIWVDSSKKRLRYF